MMDTAEIDAVLPHRAPMLLVDRVHECDAESLRATRRVRSDEPWFRASGAPADGPFPLALVLESWAQSAGVLATKDDPNPDVLNGTVMLFGSASRVEFHGEVLAGQEMEHVVRIDRKFGESVIAGGETRVDGRTVMSVEKIIMMFQPASVLRPRTAEKEEVRG